MTGFWGLSTEIQQIKPVSKAMIGATMSEDGVAERLKDERERRQRLQAAGA